MYLPHFDGPKIGPFDLFGSEFNIQFLDKIGQGGHSVLWKVKISGRVYALKMFRHYEISDFIYPMELPLLHKYGITDSDILNSWDPFINECRAYGRLQEVKKTDIAAKCYGYLILDSKNDKSLGNEDIRAVEWVKRDNWKHDGPTDKAPIRTIVKEYIESEHAFAPDMIPIMLRNLKHLHKYGIIHRDIRAANYKEGLLVDFSSAMTVPHYLVDVELGYVRAERIYSYEVHDAKDFDRMIDEWNSDNQVQIWHRFLPNQQYCGRLRSEQIVGEKDPGEGSERSIPHMEAQLAKQKKWRQEIRRRIKWHAADYDWKKGVVNKSKKKAGSKASKQ